MAKAAEDDAGPPHGDYGEGDLVEDLDEGLHLEEMFLIESVEVFEFLFGDGVKGWFAVGCLSVDEEVGAGGEEVGAAEKAEVFSDVVEGLKLLGCNVEICVLSHCSNFSGQFILHPSYFILHTSDMISGRG
ncbi:hypothetical protein SDC9_68894 [bioreactor metagenome]|uniref:Uncharacterized protein n=1 Tax=bioreactor metagenome TaxID=1076179 RepID=A0A644Y259_9ZZZZ